MRRSRRLAFVSTVIIATLPAGACSSPSEGPTIEIGDGSWLAAPVTIEAGGGSFRITVRSVASTSQQFVVVALFDGDPGALPMRDGELDLRRDGVAFDSENPGVATFGVVHPQYERREGEDVAPGNLTPDTINPGEEKQVTIGGSKGGGEPGRYVVLSYVPGRYEQGDYAAFTITE